MSNETKTNNDKPKSIIIYANQWPALSNLSAQELGWLFEAIFRTIRGEQGVIKTLDAHIKLAYDFMMTQINIDVEKWERSKALHKERQKRYREKSKVTSRDALPIKDIDKDIDILEGQIRKVKTKKDKQNMTESIRLKEELRSEDHEVSNEIIKTIYYSIKPMGPEDAKLLLAGDPQNRFLTFINIETGKVNVLYKLKDNKNFGLLEPEA